MSSDEQILARVEALRIPLDDSDSPLDWKDWYHFVLLDLDSGVRSLVNINLMGRPGQGEIQVSFLVNIPNELISPSLQRDRPVASFGTTFSVEWKPDMVRPSPLLVQGKGFHLEINGKNAAVQVQDDRAQLSIRFQTEAEATPLLVTEDSPFGSGYIGWGLVPGLQVVGELSVCGQNFKINQNWFCYHDRNFGRFRWGEDIGWEWFVASFRCNGHSKLTFVLDWRTNKDHSQSGMPYIFIYLDNKLCKVFLGASLQINWEWSPDPILPARLPGIMASLFSDRTLKMPQALQITAADEQDHLLLKVDFDAAIELVIPDNQARQYTFIAEVTGKTEVNLSLKGEVLRSNGLIYAEYVT